MNPDSVELIRAMKGQPREREALKAPARLRAGNVAGRWKPCSVASSDGKTSVYQMIRGGRLCMEVLLQPVVDDNEQVPQHGDDRRQQDEYKQRDDGERGFLLNPHPSCHRRGFLGALQQLLLPGMLELPTLLRLQPPAPLIAPSRRHPGGEKGDARPKRAPPQSRRGLRSAAAMQLANRATWKRPNRRVLVRALVAVALGEASWRPPPL